MSYCDRTRWLVDILSRVRRKLASRRDKVDHIDASKIRSLIAGIDAAILIAKEIGKEKK
jgi:hypothetical protein